MVSGPDSREGGKRLSQRSECTCEQRFTKANCASAHHLFLRVSALHITVPLECRVNRYHPCLNLRCAAVWTATGPEH